MKNKAILKVSPEIKKEIKQKISELKALLKKSGTQIIYDEESIGFYILPKGCEIDNNEMPNYPELIEADMTFSLDDLEKIPVPIEPYTPGFNTIVCPNDPNVGSIGTANRTKIFK